MKEVKRWVSPYAAGTESYKALQVVCDRAEPDPDEGPFFVLASDFDSIVKELEGKLKVADDYLRKIEREVVNCEDGDESDCLDTISADLVEALAQIEGK